MASDVVVLSRRSFVGGLLAIPAIVHARNLMPVSSPWTLVQEVQVGRVFTPWVVRYWSQNGVIRSETQTLWYGRREWNRPAPARYLGGGHE